MYTKDTILKSLAMVNMNPVIIMDQVPLTHLLHTTFPEAMVRGKKSTAKAEALWRLLVDRFCHQRELNKDVQKETETIKNTVQFSTLLIKCTISEPLKSIYQDNFVYFSEKITDASAAKKQEKAKENYMSFLRGIVRSANSGFEQFAHKLHALLTISENHKLALQLGGTDLNTFSYDRGRCSLEQTVLDNLLNNTPITTLWNLEVPPQNIISRTFVSRYTWLPVRIYFRVLDSASVLLRQGLPLMQKNNAALVIHRHPVFSYPKGMAEIGVRDEAVTESGRSINDTKVVTELLIAKLGATGYKANKQAYERMNSGYFDPTRPPFVVDE